MSSHALSGRGGWRAMFVLFFATLMATKAGQATAEQATTSISVEIGKAHALELTVPATTVFVVNPDIADVQANDPRRVMVFGRKAGTTAVYVTQQGGRVQAYTIDVVRDVAQVEAALRVVAPTAGISVMGAPNGITVTGLAATPREAETLKAVAQLFVGEKDVLDFKVGVSGGTQVNLQVRIAEVSRSVSRSFGFNWNAIFNNGSVAIGLLTGRAPLSDTLGDFSRNPSTDQLGTIGLGYQGGSTNVSALVDALQAQGLVTMLAEPNLTATSGETASFLAGGEFPVPVAQSRDQVTVEWKKFGVSLDFTPTVLDAGRISIKVRPEVSQLSDNGAVTLNNIKVPSIAVRRAETTVELASGQSFAIAGLFQDGTSSSVRRFPGLGDLPILGALFRSTSFKRDKSELVIIVTPYIVRPTSPASLRAPTDDVVFANALEQILYGRMVHKPDSSGSPPPHLAGPAGFMLDEKP